MDWTAFWSHWAWPFATALVGFVFSYLILRQYLQRRKLHQLAWLVGLLMYAIAAAMEAVSEFTGTWDPTVYRVYIVLAASLVGFLGLGTLYLTTRRPAIGHAYALFNIAALLVFLYGSLTADLREDVLVAGITVGGKPLGASFSFPRVCSFLFNIPGSLLLLGGAIYSIFLFSKKKEYAYRVWANVLIAVGTVVIAGAGSMARTGQTVGLYPAEMVGLSFMLWGFLKASTLRKGAEAIRADRAEREEPVPV
ncbi:MAG: hypothetical protein ACYC1U_04050 [Candidatus Aquicultorales bacterium]